MAGTLYLVPTPIGNLGDISRRIADTLGEVDFIAAEDTRVTLKLLNHLGLKKPMLSYYRHNTGAGGEAVLADTLGEVDFIAAEDTRVTLKLLNHLGLKKPMLSYYRHNTGAGGEAVLGRLLAGESCALVTDAGTPAVSDPGEELVALCAQSGVDVVAIPGPCALAGHRRGHSGGFRPRRGAGGPLRPEWGGCGGHPRPLRPGHRPGGVRPAHRPVHL